MYIFFLNLCRLIVLFGIRPAECNAAAIYQTQGPALQLRWMDRLEILKVSPKQINLHL